jgi:hypothetical protein
LDETERLTRGQLLTSIAFGLLIAAVGIGGFFLGLAHVFRQPDHVRLEVDPAALDLGEVWAQSGLVVRLPVRNAGIRPVTVRDVRTSGCLCTSVTPREFEIPAGGQVVLRLRLDLAAGDEGRKVPAAEDFSIRLDLLVAGGTGDGAGWVLAGRMRRAFRVHPNPLRFGGASSPVAGLAGPVKEVMIEPLVPVAQLATVGSPLLRSRVRRAEKGWRVLVEPSDTMAAGEFQCDLSLRARLASGELLPPYVLRVTGRCLDEVEAIPSAIQFGIVEAGATAQAGLVVYVHRGAPASVDALTGEPECIFARLESCSDEHLQLLVHLRAAQPGALQGRLRLAIRTREGRRRELAVPVDAFVLARPGQPQREASDP